MGTGELRTSALQNPPLKKRTTTHDSLNSLDLRKEKFWTQNWIVTVSSIPELWKLFPFILICHLKTGKESALLRTVSKTWDLQKLLVPPLGYIPAQQYRSSQRLWTHQILSKAPWRGAQLYFYSISKGSCFSVFLCASVDNKIFSLSQECLH